MNYRKQGSSTNNLYLLLISFGKSLMYIKNKKGHKMNPCGTPLGISTPDKH